MNRGRLSFIVLALCLVAFTAMGVWGQVGDEPVVQDTRTQIAVVGIPPRLIDEGLVDTTKIKQSSSGLHVVGVGEQVYIQPISAEYTPTGFTWTMTSKPTGSTTVLAVANATSNMQMFTPDKVGDYKLSLKITHSAGDTTVTRTITAATYVGADRCGVCHAAVKTEWEKTKHASALRKKISGFQTGHFQGRCISCHSVGANTSSVGVTVPANGGFWDAANKAGWTFPTSLTQGTWAPVGEGETASDVAFTNGAWTLDLTNSVWDQMPAEVKAMGNIQCESCHGPGSEHASTVNKAKIGRSLANGVCARCHDDGHYHVRPEEWSGSAHGQTWTRNSTTCAPCHLADGYVKGQINGLTLDSATLEVGPSITCAACHSAHSVANDHQVRFEGTVKLTALVPGTEGLQEYTTPDMGVGAQCAQCHHLRPGRDVPGNSIHHSHQTEMLQGVGGYHFPGEEYASGSHKHIEGTCATCHMSSRPSGLPDHVALGSHSWNMHDDNGTPTDKSDDYFNTTGCQSCHGSLQNFDVNGAQTEIEEMLVVLADLLPKVDGDPTSVASSYDPGGRGSATREMTGDEINAAWNYLFVHDDVSEGVHNFMYARKLLADATRSLKSTAPSATDGDFNNDGKVNFTDLFMFTSNFGKSSASAGWDARYDLSQNGVVGFTDWLMFLDLFGTSSSAGKPVAVVNNGLNTRAAFALVGSNRPSIDQDHLAVTLQVNNLTQMRGYGVELTYDPTMLEFVRAVRSEKSLIQTNENTPSLLALNPAPGRITLSDGLSGDQAVSGSGQLTDLIFRRLGAANETSVQIDFAQLSDLNFGINMPSSVDALPEASAVANVLNQNFPNPFNPATTIPYSVAQTGDVRIVVYSALGQEIRTLVDHYKLAGEYSVKWDGRDSAGREVASGIYVYRMEAGTFSATHRMVFMK